MPRDQVRTKHDLRCFCSREPLLARYGVNVDGLLYVHVKVYKQRMIYGEVLAFGPLMVKCRECLRWYTINVKQKEQTASLEESVDPNISDTPQR